MTATGHIAVCHYCAQAGRDTRLLLPACGHARWPCEKLWLIRLHGWMHDHGRSYCDKCCRDIGDGYYEPARKRKTRLAPEHVCDTCLDASGRGSAAGAAPAPPPPPGSEPPPASPPGHSAAAAAAETSSEESCVDGEADWRWRADHMEKKKAKKPSNTPAPAPPAPPGLAAPASAAPGAPAADNDDDEDDKEVLCKKCRDPAPPFRCSGGCQHSWWLRAVGWTGSAGTSNGKKAYCLKCSQRLQKRAWVDEREEAMGWLCNSCETKARQLNEEYVPQPGGPFQ